MNFIMILLKMLDQPDQSYLTLPNSPVVILSCTVFPQILPSEVAFLHNTDHRHLNSLFYCTLQLKEFRFHTLSDCKVD